jgi:hypothetical protein
MVQDMLPPCFSGSYSGESGTNRGSSIVGSGRSRISSDQRSMRAAHKSGARRRPASRASHWGSANILPLRTEQFGELVEKFTKWYVRPVHPLTMIWFCPFGFA